MQHVNMAGVCVETRARIRILKSISAGEEAGGHIYD